MSLHVIFKKRFLLCALFILILNLGTNFNLLFATQPAINLGEHVNKYNTLRVTIQAERENFHHTYRAVRENSIHTSLVEKAGTYLLKTITREIFPFWYGTAWDFNGTTQTPLRGKIACGYFVSTVLKHAGFQLDRYDLAKQPASIVINRLCQQESIRIFNRTHQLIHYLENNGNGLYILGLDYHIGFLAKEEAGLWFIHSSESGGVIREKVEDSEALFSSNLLVVGNLLVNREIIEKWLKKEKIN